MLQTLPGWVSWPLALAIMGRATQLLIRFLRRMDRRQATPAPLPVVSRPRRGKVIEVEVVRR